MYIVFFRVIVYWVVCFIGIVGVWLVLFICVIGKWIGVVWEIGLIGCGGGLGYVGIICVVLVCCIIIRGGI